MLKRGIQNIVDLLQNKSQEYLYRFYYPVLERINRARDLNEASQLFKARSSSKTPAKSLQKFPMVVYSKQNKVFKEFCISSKNEFGFETNKTGLCILMGSTGMGKSVFLKQNLRAIQQMYSSNPDKLNVCQLSCQALPAMNFDTFLYHFETTLIKSIQKQLLLHSSQSNELTNPIKVLYEILLTRYAHQMITLSAKDMIQAIINDEDIFIHTDRADIKAALSEILHVKLVEESQDFSEVFEEVAQLIADNQSNTNSSSEVAPGTIKVSVELLVSILARMEYEQRGRSVKTSFSRTGILVNSFLFDVLNYLEGYHSSNMTQTQFSQNIVVLENFDALTQRGSATDIRFINFQDHLLLRLYSDTYERDHFPVVIESSDSRFYTKELYEMMHAAYTTYGAIEIYGIPEESIEAHFNSLLSTKEVNLMKRVIGVNVDSWNKLIKYMSEESHMTFKDFEELNTPQYRREYEEFKSLIASVYLDNTVSALLDSPDHRLISFNILNIMETFLWNFGTIDISSKYAEQRILEDPVVKAMLSQKLLYMRYYYSQMMFDKFIFLKFAKKYLAEEKAKWSIQDRIAYVQWRFKHGIEKQSLILLSVFNFKTKKAPQNNREYFNYKIESEHLQFKGIDLQAKPFNLSTHFQSTYLK